MNTHSGSRVPTWKRDPRLCRLETLPPELLQEQCIQALNLGHVKHDRKQLLNAVVALACKLVAEEQARELDNVASVALPQSSFQSHRQKPRLVNTLRSQMAANPTAPPIQPPPLPPTTAPSPVRLPQAHTVPIQQLSELEVVDGGVDANALGLDDWGVDEEVVGFFADADADADAGSGTGTGTGAASASDFPPPSLTPPAPEGPVFQERYNTLRDLLATLEGINTRI